MKTQGTGVHGEGRLSSEGAGEVEPVPLRAPSPVSNPPFEVGETVRYMGKRTEFKVVKCALFDGAWQVDVVDPDHKFHTYYAFALYRRN